jgi:hypothetical protein
MLPFTGSRVRTSEPNIPLNKTEATNETVRRNETKPDENAGEQKPESNATASFHPRHLESRKNSGASSSGTNVKKRGVSSIEVESEDMLPRKSSSMDSNEKLYSYEARGRGSSRDRRRKWGNSGRYSGFSRSYSPRFSRYQAPSFGHQRKTRILNKESRSVVNLERTLAKW